MKIWLISFVIILHLLVALLGVSLVIKPSIPVEVTSQAQYPTPEPVAIQVLRLLELTNIERLEVGVAPLVLDERLNQSALIKSSEMFELVYFSHTSPSGIKSGDLINSNGLSCQYWGENLARFVLSSEETVAGWVNSPGHYRNLIEPRLTIVGFGVKDTYVTQHFCG